MFMFLENFCGISRRWLDIFIIVWLEVHLFYTTKCVCMFMYFNVFVYNFFKFCMSFVCYLRFSMSCLQIQSKTNEMNVIFLWTYEFNKYKQLNKSNRKTKFDEDYLVHKKNIGKCKNNVLCKDKFTNTKIEYYKKFNRKTMIDTKEINDRTPHFILHNHSYATTNTEINDRIPHTNCTSLDQTLLAASHIIYCSSWDFCVVEKKMDLYRIIFS